MTATVNSINKIFKKFLADEGQDDIFENWMSPRIQTSLKRATTQIHNKQVKDPNAPKRALTAYIFFCTENRPKVKKSLGAETNVIDVTRKLGEMWNDLNKRKPSSIKKYEKLAKEDKERYQREMETYKSAMASATPDDFKAPAHTPQKKTKDPNAPKRARSAYLFFCDDNRQSVREQLGPDHKMTDVMAKLGEMWKELKNTGGDDYDTYVELANQDSERYEREIAEYKA